MTSLNPVIGRELIERLRGLRAFVAITIFVLVLTLTMFLVVEAYGANGAGTDITDRTGTGRVVFETLITLMTVLVLFFVPALTAGAVAGERERQTLSTLQVTMLRERSILAGKVVAAVVYLALLIVASIPVLGVAYAYGGVQVGDIAWGLLAVIVWALLLSTMVVAVSSFAKRVQTATVLAYGFTGLITIIGPLLYGIAALLDSRRGDPHVSAPAWLLTLNPYTLVADLGSGNKAGGTGPLSLWREALGYAKAENDGSWFSWFPDDANDQQHSDVGLLGRPIGGLPAWLLAAVGLSIVALVLLAFAVRRMRTPAEAER